MGEDQPKVVLLDKNGVAPMSDKAIRLKAQLFPINRSYGENYLNINALYNINNTGIMQKLKPVEDRIFDTAIKKLEAWRGNNNFKQQIPEFYKFINQTILNEYIKWANRKCMETWFFMVKEWHIETDYIFTTELLIKEQQSLTFIQTYFLNFWKFK